MPSFRRLVRGVRAILGLSRPDDAWARERLRPDEYALFAKLDPRDREHSVLVAKELLRRHPEAPEAAVRAALLHDVGKAVRPYRAIERILTALLEPWLPDLPEEPRLPGWRGAVQVRLHHERYAADLVSDPSVRALILAMKNEAEPEIRKWARRIAEVDDLF